MKYLLITLLALTTMALGVMGLGSSDPRELISLSNENSAFAVPSIRINGVSNLLQILNSATAYTNSTFDIITIDSFSQVTTDQGVAIQGKVTLTNDQNESVTGLITGVWDAINNKILLNATQYEETGESDESDSEGETTTDSSNPTVDEDGYTPLEVNPTEVDTPVSSAFNWGVKALIETGERQNKIPISDYSVTEWTSAAYKNLTNGISYKFVAELLGANYVHVETNMTVFYSDSDQSYQLNGYYYRATNISEGSLPNNFTDVDNSTNSTDVNNNSTDIKNNSTDVNNSTDINNGTNSTNNTISTPAVPDGYTYISSADLVNNSLAQSALSWGVDTLIQKIIGQYKLPAASPVYNVSNLILAAYKNTSTGANYIYQTNLTNALKYKVDANFTVAYRDSNQTFKLNGYAFRSYNYPSGAIVILPNNTNATNSTNNATNSTSGSSNSTNNSTGNATVPDDSTDVSNSTGNATQPGNNSTTNSTNNSTNPANNSTTNSTGNATQPTNSTNSTNPVNNTTLSNQTTADGYTIMNSTQLANDAIAQVALQNGTQTLIKTGINQYKIPSANANYTINNVTFAGYKKGNIGTSYKFSVNMTNIDYVHVDANITVFYRYSTHVYSLNGWSFRSYNYTTDPSNNNSTTPPDMDPPIYDDGSGDGIPIIIEPSDGGSGAR